MNILQHAHNRKSTKAFDPEAKISTELWQEILEYLRFAPSSTNLQPWKFFFAHSPESKAKIAPAFAGPYAANGEKIAQASHVIVFCSKTSLSDAELMEIALCEAQDQRTKSEDEMQNMHQRRMFFADLHRKVKGDFKEWAAKQVYLALGHLLIGLESMGVQACPIEGFDLEVMDTCLELQGKYASCVVLALGYRSAQDWNEKLPKSRLGLGQIFQEIGN